MLKYAVKYTLTAPVGAFSIYMPACPSGGIFKPFSQSLKANGHPKGLTIVPTPHKTQPPGKRVYKTGLRWRDAAFEKEDIVMRPAQENVY